MPVLYKHAVDALPGAPGAVAVPLGLILAYGGARVLSLIFSELRDAIFARVGQHAIRAVGLQIFRHLHGLALRFHLARQTGGLNRAIERGTKGIQTLLSFLLFNILPTFFEIGLVCLVLWRMFDGWLALATGATVTLYIAYTLLVTEWRAKFRRQMNETDSEANTKAIESLLNYETVKYFGNEEHEARRFDASLSRYERAAVRSQVSLSILNIGQAAIISAGLTLVMWMAAQGHRRGPLHAGRLRAGQHLPAAAVFAAELLRLHLPRDQAGHHRHGAHVRAAGPGSRDRRPARRAIWPCPAPRSNSATCVSATTSAGRS